MVNEVWQTAQEQEKRFWLNYFETYGLDRIHKQLDYFHQIYYLPMLAKHIGLSVNIDVLEVGCGPCGLVPIIQNTKARVGIEPLADWFTEQGVQYHDIGYNIIHGCSLDYIFTERPYWLSKLFDVTICCNVLDHVVGLDEFLCNLIATIKPDGKLFLAYDNRFQPTELHPTRTLFWEIEPKFVELGCTLIERRINPTEHEPDCVNGRSIEVWRRNGNS